MTQNQKWFLGCLMLAVIGVCGALGVLASLQIPEVAEQIPPNSSPMVVTLKTPLNGASVPTDNFTTVTAEARGTPSNAVLELWVDGARLQTQTVPPNSTLNPFSAFWTWTPAGEGEHTLFVRAADALGHAATSNIVHVTATENANEEPTVNYLVQTGDTLAALAQQFQTTPQEIVELNPEIDPNNPITSGQNISVPIPLSTPPAPGTPQEPQPPPPADEPPPASDAPPNKFSEWISINIWNYFVKASLPLAPGLSKKEDGCNVKLFITDNSNDEDGFFVYRADKSSQIFKRIATLGSHNATGAFTYVDSNVYGTAAYYVASFNAAGEAPSPYVQAEITTNICAISISQVIQLSDAKIVVQQPVDKVYCYLSTNGDPWTRVPPVPNTFIYPQNGEFDMGDFISTLLPAEVNGAVTLDLECWGWSGGTLTFLGEIKETFLPTPKPLPIKFSGAKLDLVASLAATQVMSGTVPNGKITHPINLRGTTDPAECAAHLPLKQDSPAQVPKSQVGECSAEIMSQKLIMVWDWDPKSAFVCTPKSCPTTLHTIEGYKLYGFGVQSNGTQVNRTLLATMTPDKTKAYANWPFPGVCFAVRAFWGPIESIDSNVFCPPQGSFGSTSVKLNLQPPPYGLTQRYENYWRRSGSIFFNTLSSVGINPCAEGEDEVCIGFHWSRDLYGFDELRTYHQGAVRFDLTPILNKNVVKATLGFKRIKGSLVVASNAGGFMNCAETLGIGTTNWTHTVPIGTFLPSTPYSTLAQTYYPYQVNVTTPVTNWANGSTENNGFVLNGIAPFGPPGKGNENQCTTNYGHFELEVVTGK